MTPEITFVVTVAKMRTAQKKYFKSRTQTNLKAALEIEADVDRQIAQFAGDSPAVTHIISEQTRLFG
ncbi:hypothetical protein [Spirosoma oryzicola]|uniref:hypothetical protein n=1 Tax=Spirosoma oryzicola TaxID=2898794 RepID=UPI001E31D724|nr:hypothetical protein [Spirosoma oryzicola]UHG93408.1 hypothetical protein LQ777_11000 [Spirosoma oryzicola]